MTKGVCTIFLWLLTTKASVFRALTDKRGLMYWPVSFGTGLRAVARVLKGAGVVTTGCRLVEKCSRPGDQGGWSATGFYSVGDAIGCFRQVYNVLWTSPTSPPPWSPLQNVMIKPKVIA